MTKLLLSVAIVLLYASLSGAKQCDASGASCADSQTCCRLTNGQWGCCPAPSATCCNDNTCCPSGSSCAGNGRCARLAGEHFFLDENAAHRVEATLIEVEVVEVAEEPVKTKEIQCGNSQDTCPDSTTCCQLTTGGWGCCPYDGGVCCDGEDACCPGGTTCTGTGRCARGTGLPRFFQETASVRVKATTKPKTKEVQCGSGEDSCPDATTCCQLTTGGWGCCPYDGGVCCDGEDACCPGGTTCTGTGRCARGTRFPFIFEDTAAARVKARKTQKQCGNSDDTCADNQTCCQLTTGGWGCCPYEGGVCCDGEDACCPGGTTCTGTGRCARGTGLPRIFEFTASARVHANRN